MLEAITNEGNGIYYYIDSEKEARRVFLEGLMGTLVTIAKDVKIQVEFNPGKVGQYRLIGYANRVLQKEDFNNDRVDAGDIGAGHQVTAFYEVVPVGVEGTVRPEVDDLKYQAKERPAPVVDSAEWMTVKLRHKKPDAEVSSLQSVVLEGEAGGWREMDGDFRYAAGVALWGMGLRGRLEAEEGLLWELIEGTRNGREKWEELWGMVQDLSSSDLLPEEIEFQNTTRYPIRGKIGKRVFSLSSSQRHRIDFSDEGVDRLDVVFQYREGKDWKRLLASRWVMPLNGPRIFLFFEHEGQVCAKTIRMR
ncbi:MAG: YfbK domain-containing protein [Verrucomicrobiota bacterium]